jgi:hypothetical protein
MMVITAFFGFIVTPAVFDLSNFLPALDVWFWVVLVLDAIGLAVTFGLPHLQARSLRARFQAEVERPGRRIVLSVEHDNLSNEVLVCDADGVGLVALDGARKTINWAEVTDVRSLRVAGWPATRIEFVLANQSSLRLLPLKLSGVLASTTADVEYIVQRLVILRSEFHRLPHDS